MQKQIKYTDLPIMPRTELQEQLLTVGATPRVWVNDGDGVYKVHVETILQYPNTTDDLHKMIVYRYYGKHKQRWHYSATMLWELLIYNGYREVIKELNFNK